MEQEYCRQRLLEGLDLKLQTELQLVLEQVQRP